MHLADVPEPALRGHCKPNELRLREERRQILFARNCERDKLPARHLIIIHCLVNPSQSLCVQTRNAVLRELLFI